MCVGVRDVASWWSCKLRQELRNLDKKCDMIRRWHRVITSSTTNYLVFKATRRFEPRHHGPAISSDCGEMSVALFFADGGGSPRSALRHGRFVPLLRVHHRCPGVRAISLPPGLRAASKNHAIMKQRCASLRTGAVTARVGTKVTRMAYQAAGWK